METEAGTRGDTREANASTVGRMLVEYSELSLEAWHPTPQTLTRRSVQMVIVAKATRASLTPFLGLFGRRRTKKKFDAVDRAAFEAGVGFAHVCLRCTKPRPTVAPIGILEAGHVVTRDDRFPTCSGGVGFGVMSWSNGDWCQLVDGPWGSQWGIKLSLSMAWIWMSASPSLVRARTSGGASPRFRVGWYDIHANKKK